MEIQEGLQNIHRGIRLVLGDIGKVRFSTSEIIKLVISMIVIAFSFSFRDLIFPTMPYHISFVSILIALGLAFMIHEIAHKVSSQTWGIDAEFDLLMYHGIPVGLLLTIVSAILTGGMFVFAAPGAVMIKPSYEKQIQLQNNPNIAKKVIMEISFAGILMNMIAAVGSMLLLIILSITGMISTTSLGAYILSMCYRINVFLAFFNLLPLPMLDGSKMFAINKKIWAIFFVASLFLLYLPYI